MALGISVVIPTYNRADMLVRCVGSILATDYPALEVIVVDDCSPDGTAERVAREFGSDRRVRCIRNARNLQLAASRNAGARAATREWIFFLDDDNIVHPDIFEEFEKTSRRRPNAAFIAPLAIHRRQGSEGEIWTIGSDFNRWTSQPKDRASHLPLKDLPADVTEYDTTYSPNGFLVRREAFERVGGCDESFGIMFDESDFGWRIGEAGYEMVISTGARTDHYGMVEPGCVSRLRYLGIEKPGRTYLFARNRLRFARRHFSVLQALSVALVFAPLSCAYYCAVAVRNRRPDIAWAYLKGTVRGLLGLL